MKLQTDTTNTNFDEVLSLIVSSKQKAFTHVNSILIELYWRIGEYISAKTTRQNWGKSVVKELADFIHLNDPTLRGFTDRNLWRMKQFYETYHQNEKLSALLTQLTWTNHLLILSSSKNDEVVKYALSRSLSPTVISEYETKLIPKEILQRKLNELYEAFEIENEIGMKLN